MKKNLKIGIAEDHPVVREGLVTFLNRAAGLLVVFDVGDGQQLMNAIESSKPDVILLDLDMPVMHGRAALSKIQKKYPKIKIIIFSAIFQDALILDLVKMGINSFVHKASKMDVIIEAIIAVNEKDFYFDSKVAALLAKEVAEPTIPDLEIYFSETDINILKLLSKGKSSKEIAAELFINQRTVEWHRGRMMASLKLKNVVELVVYGIQNNLISLT